MKSLLILATVVLLAQADTRAPFQVSIQLKNSNQLQICSGIIIHEEYILTTANCFYLQLAGTGFSILATAGDLTVIAGSPLSTTPLERNVVSIIPHHKFNKTTYDNDIAVLKLDRALPLANSTEAQWLDIATGNGGGSSDSCFLTVFNSSQESSGSYSIWSKPASESCNDLNGTNLIHETDLCLEYFLSTNAECNSTSINLIRSNERGTAYVCNNKLVAILAAINPPGSVEKCYEKNQTTGSYVDVTRYVDWLSTELKIPRQSPSVPSWTVTTMHPETSYPTTITSTTKPSSAARLSCGFIPVLLSLLLMKLALFF